LTAVVFAAAALLTLNTGPSFCADPLHEGGKRTIHFRARVTGQDNEPVANGMKTLVFRLYEFPVGGEPLWTEVHPSVNVMDGYADVVLGGITPFDSMVQFAPDTEGGQKPWKKHWSTFEKPLYVGVSVDIDGIPDNPAVKGSPEAELLPRQELLPSVFALDAFAAKEADGLSHQPAIPKLAATPRREFWLDPTVVLDASGSISPRGERLEFGWDLDGDGLPAAYSQNATATIPRDPAPGASVLARVFVRDEKGLVSPSAPVLINNSPYRTLTTVVTSSTFAAQPSLAVINNRPAVALVNQDGDLIYMAAPTKEGGGAWTLRTAAPGIVPPGTNCPVSLQALADGSPAIAYRDQTATPTVGYVRATTPAAQTWTAPLTIPSAGSAGPYLSMAVVAGKPTIAYSNDSLTSLSCIQATDDAGTSWAAPNVIESKPPGQWGIEPLGLYVSLAEMGGTPAVAYLETVPDGGSLLTFNRATNPDGSGWQDPPQVLYMSYSRHVGGISMSLVAGQPSIAYVRSYWYPTVQQELVYLRSGDAQGLTWGAEELVDTTPSISSFDAVPGCVSLASVGGRPVIAYASASGGEGAPARYAISNSADGLGGWTIRIVDNRGDEFPTVSLAVVGDRPAISYTWSRRYYGSGVRLLLGQTSDGLGEWTKVDISDNSIWSEDLLPASVTSVGGVPAVGYRDESDSTFRFATFDRH
jgi:hypothetical protein